MWKAGGEVSWCVGWDVCCERLRSWERDHSEPALAYGREKAVLQFVDLLIGV